mmetsp:Transcript_64271/g.126440  ORF Transcript_64271/g.126440 Transcript_64271/m.126440 type:complete len:239 (+) Transcript_64271:193-909(+)
MLLRFLCPRQHKRHLGLRTPEVLHISPHFPPRHCGLALCGGVNHHFPVALVGRQARLIRALPKTRLRALVGAQAAVNTILKTITTALVVARRGLAQLLPENLLVLRGTLSNKPVVVIAAHLLVRRRTPSNRPVAAIAAHLRPQRLHLFLQRLKLRFYRLDLLRILLLLLLTLLFLVHVCQRLQVTRPLALIPQAVLVLQLLLLRLPLLQFPVVQMQHAPRCMRSWRAVRLLLLLLLRV